MVWGKLSRIFRCLLNFKLWYLLSLWIMINNNRIVVPIVSGSRCNENGLYYVSSSSYILSLFSVHELAEITGNSTVGHFVSTVKLDNRYPRIIVHEKYDPIWQENAMDFHVSKVSLQLYFIFFNINLNS